MYTYLSRVILHLDDVIEVGCGEEERELYTSLLGLWGGSRPAASAC